MLSELHVKNLALIEKADIEFGEGLNILTGETGAGKSIIIGSVTMALGGKVPKDIIRRGTEYAYVELLFTVTEPDKVRVLKEMDVCPDEGGTVIISRKIMPARSLCKINDETVTVGKLKTITGLLIDIHGQHEHQSLLYKHKHLEILDKYHERKSHDLKQNIAGLYRTYTGLKDRVASFHMDEESRLREMDFLRFEIDEIEGANVKDGEEEELTARYRLFTNARRIAESLSAAYEAVNTDTLDYALKEVEHVASFDEKLGAIRDQLFDADDIPTLIFDEIDTGISGRTAQMVSEKLSYIAKNHQVICITHLPQIAAMADAHYEIAKTAADGRTTTTIRPLAEAEMVEELARLLGGAKITEAVRENAREMKRLAGERK